MIIRHRNVNAGEVFRADVCIIGAGAAGITIAMELGRSGIHTLVIPGGGRRYNSRYQKLYKGTSREDIPLDRARQRRFGGTTAVWGGRCIPLDPIDFAKRPFVDHSGWPIDASHLAHYYRRSQEYLDLGTNFHFNVEKALPDVRGHLIEGFDDDVLLTDRVEKFSLPTNLGKKYYREMASSSTIKVVMDSHLIGVEYTGAGSEVSALSCITKRGTMFQCEGASYVLAMGALEVTRHLLQPSEDYRDGVGNRSGLLGKFFMTHFSGVIAEVAIKQELEVINRYELDKDGVYCRRRLQLSEAAQMESGILNFSSFLHHPPLEDPDHRDPLLSLIFFLKGVRHVGRKIPAEYSAWLAYGRFGPRDYALHLRNIVLGFPQLVLRIPWLIRKRILRRRKLPSVIIDYKNNCFTLHYHVEHAPHCESQVTLSEQTDEHGLRRLHVSMQYKDIDVESILKAHHIIKDRLEGAGVGTLRFLTDDPVEGIKRQIAFGGHQIGTTRMALREEDGVVDTNCKVFGVGNLYVASPSVFPTGGQANPVLTIVALAIRLADHLRTTAPRVASGRRMPR